MGGRISKIIEGSIAWELGIRPGDELVSIDGAPVGDLIDFDFLSAAEETVLAVKKPNGELWEYEVEKDYDEELGIVFASNVFDGIRRCRNHCVFCFEDQLQPHPRESLHAKDDDYRMSFLEGNFITCTNMTEDDFRRIERLRLSPLYVSVHTVDPQLRCEMMRNKQAGRIMDDLRRLIAAGCQLHTQIVLCPGFNDGDKLTETIETLRGLYPAADGEGGVISAAVVPVGITRYQRDPAMRLLTTAEAGQVLDVIEAIQARCLKESGSHFVFPADELYIKAGRPFPPADTYENFPQLENGIGMTALFRQRYEALKDSVPAAAPSENLGIVTGINGRAAILPCVEDINRRCGGQIDLLTVENSFYGPTVTATGLLTGSCLLQAIPAATYDRLLLPANMLKFDEDIFLDDVTLPQLEQELRTPVTVADCTPESLINAIFHPEIN